MITISGPTAVGKTNLTLTLAKKYNSHIFSADSRQLYHELNIGTAKPSLNELEQTTHYFINHISIKEEYSVARYEEEIDALFDGYYSSNDIGILSGGTGMYIKAALEGLDYFPTIKDGVKEHYELLLEENGIGELQQLLLKKDPTYADQVDMSNSRRLVRALSVIESSGEAFSSFLAQKSKKVLPFHPINICLTRNREDLYARINARVDQMMEDGLLDEVKNLVEWQNMKSLKTVGYSEIFKHLNGEISLSEAIDLIKRNSRRYAKRQMTWFRNQGKWVYFDADDVDGIIGFIESERLRIEI